MAFTERLLPKEVPSSGFRCRSVGKNFSESLGKSVISVCKRTKKGKTRFMAVKKTRKLLGLVI